MYCKVCGLKFKPGIPHKSCEESCQENVAFCIVCHEKIEKFSHEFCGLIIREFGRFEINHSKPKSTKIIKESKLSG